MKAKKALRKILKIYNKTNRTLNSMTSSRDAGSLIAGVLDDIEAIILKVDLTTKKEL